MKKSKASAGKAESGFGAAPLLDDWLWQSDAFIKVNSGSASARYLVRWLPKMGKGVMVCDKEEQVLEAVKMYLRNGDGKLEIELVHFM